jgi:phage terminase small subunit
MELNGAWDKNPKRRRDSVTCSEGIGEPPAHMSEGAQVVWSEITRHAHWLTAADRQVLEYLCVMYDEFRRGELKTGAYGHLRGALGQLGLTPADRSKITVKGDGEKKNPFSDLDS